MSRAIECITQYSRSLCLASDIGCWLKLTNCGPVLVTEWLAPPTFRSPQLIISSDDNKTLARALVVNVTGYRTRYRVFLQLVPSLWYRTLNKVKKWWLSSTYRVACTLNFPVPTAHHIEWWQQNFSSRTCSQCHGLLNALQSILAVCDKPPISIIVWSCEVLVQLHLTVNFRQSSISEARQQLRRHSVALSISYGINYKWASSSIVVKTPWWAVCTERERVHATMKQELSHHMSTSVKDIYRRLGSRYDDSN